MPWGKHQYFSKLQQEYVFDIVRIQSALVDFGRICHLINMILSRNNVIPTYLKTLTKLNERQDFQISIAARKR